jgi:hypothetical protein
LATGRSITASSARTVITMRRQVACTGAHLAGHARTRSYATRQAFDRPLHGECEPLRQGLVSAASIPP